MSLLTTQAWTEKKKRNEIKKLQWYYFMTKRIITSDLHVVINVHQFHQFSRKCGTKGEKSRINKKSC